MMKRLLKIMLIMTVLCGAHGAPYGGWLSGVEAQAAQALVPATGQTTSYAAGDDGALRPGVSWDAASRFINNGNGTITDTLTGLIWLQNPTCTDSVGGVDKSSGYLTWANALTWSNNLASGSCGLTDSSAAGDWRIPNIEELESLVDLERNNPALPSDFPFNGVWNGGYWWWEGFWTSSTYAGSTNYVWGVVIGDGSVNYTFRDKASHFAAWPVRGGQSWAFGSLSISPGTKDFGNVTTNNTSTGQTFTISNTGAAGLVVSSIILTDGDNGMFTLASGNGSGGTCGATPTITPAGSCTVSATFTPTSTGAKTTTLRIASNDPATPNKDVALSGTGALPTYTVGTSVVGGNGSITCESPVISGTTSNCNISPNGGYQLATFTDNLVDKLGSVGSNSYRIINVTANHTVSGTFVANYSVTYNGNTSTGGSVPTDAGSYANGTTVTVLGNSGTLTKTGYTFAGWNTLANGRGTSQAAASTFNMGSGNVTLYAKWIGHRKHLHHRTHHGGQHRRR